MSRPKPGPSETALPASRPSLLERHDWALPVKGRWAEAFLLAVFLLLGCLFVVFLSKFSLYATPGLGPDGSRTFQTRRSVGRDGLNHFILWVDGTCYDIVWE
jgi:hypothetical protein